MSSKAENLVKSIRAAQQFLHERTPRYPAQEQITQELAEILNLSTSKKLTIEIFSSFSTLTQAAYNCLTNSSILELYQFKISTISNTSTSQNFKQSSSACSIVLQPNSAVGQSETRYGLSTSSNILIGRDYQQLKTDSRSQNAKLIALPDYKKISSVHARIIPSAVSSFSSQSWQICDLDSRNGTYINGQQISGCRTLQSGDRITLAYSTASEKSPEFVFETQVDNSSIQDIPIDSDIVCLVINHHQLLSSKEKQVIDQINNSQASVLIIILDPSGSDSHFSQKLDSTLEGIDNWVKIQYPKIYGITEVISLELNQFLSSLQKNSPDPTIQKKLNEFHNSLVNLYQIRFEEILISRLIRRSLLQIEQIEHLVDTRNKTLNWEIQETNTKLQGRSLDDWREHLKESFRVVNEQRQEFLYQVRTELSSAKTDFSTSFVPGSLMQKIELFTKNLTSYVEKESGQICIQLKTENKVAAHEAIIELCQAELLQWSNGQWQQICWSYGAGGLNGLFQRSYAQLNNFASLQVSNPFRQPISQLNLEKDLSKSFIEAESSSFSESPDNTLIQAATVGIKAAIGLGMLYMGDVSASRHVSGAVVGLAGLVGSKLSQSQLRQRNLDQIEASLKRSTSAYYQNIARYLLEKLVQNINRSLDAEDRHFRQGIEEINGQITTYLMELKRCTDGYKTHQDTLNQDKAILKQIKSLVV